jgi:phospholipid transport system substrate-binding protein
MKISRTRKFILSIALATLLALSAANAIAESPTDQVKATIDQVITVLSDPKLRGVNRRAERQKLLRELIHARFDFQEMAKRSLGAQWRRRTPDEQRQFVILFRDLLEKAYLGRIESYGNERFVYINEKIDEPYAEVASAIGTNTNEEFSIRYRLLRAGEQWKIYDVIVEDISLVNNYRAQFNRILSQSPYEELIRRMKSKLSDKPDGRTQ